MAVVSVKLALSRKKATMVSGAILWLLGIISVWSLNVLKDFHPLGFVSVLEGKTIFESLDYISASILLPIGGFLTAIFVGWMILVNAMKKYLGIKEYQFEI